MAFGFSRFGHGCRLVVLAIAIGIGGVVSLDDAHAQTMEARDNPVPVSRSAGSGLTVYLKSAEDMGAQWHAMRPRRPNLALGRFVSVCVTASADGYLSIWSRTMDGAPPVRVFPNDFTPRERLQKAGTVKSGKEICIGDGSVGFGLQVGEPLGQAEVYVHWSRSIDGQFGPEDMPQIPDPTSRALIPVEVQATGDSTNNGGDFFQGGARYQSATVGYVVTR